MDEPRTLIIQPVAECDLATILPRVLAAGAGMQDAEPAACEAFAAQLAQSRWPWSAWRSGAHAALLLQLPGQTELALISPVDGERAADEVRPLVAQLVRAARVRAPYFVQALLEPQAHLAAQLLTEGGFEALAELDYLERAVLFPWIDVTGPPLNWLPYSPAREGLFAQTLLSTYEASRDCPQLSGVRPVAAVLDAHRAAGVFEAALWELALHGETVVGVLLLAWHPLDASLEVVYMGLTPAARGAGVGRALLARALAQARRKRARRIHLAVDRANLPAQRVYRACGFRRYAERAAYWLKMA